MVCTLEMKHSSLILGFLVWKLYLFYLASILSLGEENLVACQLSLNIHGWIMHGLTAVQNLPAIIIILHFHFWLEPEWDFFHAPQTPTDNDNYRYCGQDGFQHQGELLLRSDDESIVILGYSMEPTSCLCIQLFIHHKYFLSAY